MSLPILLLLLTEACISPAGTDLYEVNIPLTDVPEGIAQLSLFDNQMRPVSERLVYVHHPNSVVHISTDKNNYRKREKVSMPLTIIDPDGKQLAGIYSVAVTDDHVVKTGENEENIKTHLLLSPYLKGHIQEPGYYFNNETASTMDNLDLVMLTHGWSRFTWSDIENDAAIQPPPKDSSLSISGKLGNGKTPASHYAVSLFSVSDNNYIGTDTTNEKGEFHFTGIDFTDSTSFFIQTKNRKGFNETLDVSIDPLYFPLTNVDRSYPPQEPDWGMVNGANFYKRFMYDLVKSDKILLLKEVTISSTKRKINFDESRRVSQVSHIITSDLIERFGNFLHLKDILYSVPGVTITDGHISFFGLNSMSNYTDPLYFLDGVESSAALESINPFEIDFIEVLRGGEAAIYGMRGANGVVLVNTKKGKDIVPYFTQKGIKALQAPGYHVEKDFYAPRYETEESKLAKTNDERTTIYWNGNITSDSKTPAIISFYTADMPSTYTITIEGIAENGEAIHQTFPLKRTRL